MAEAAEFPSRFKVAIKVGNGEVSIAMFTTVLLV